MPSITALVHIHALLESAVAINGTLTLMPDQCQALLDARAQQERERAVAAAAQEFAQQYHNTIDLDGHVTYSQQQKLDAAWVAWQSAVKAAAVQEPPTAPYTR